MPRLQAIALLFLGALLSGFVAAWLFVQAPDLPAVESLQSYRPKGVTRLLDRRGELLGEIFHERRLPVRLEQMPALLRQAVISTEDAEFYQHHGFSTRGIVRALWKNIWQGRVAQGGSTLTQQLSKVLFLTPDRSLPRKIKELFLALQIERTYTKDEILELYLNQIYLGEGNYGVAAAASYYFCKPLEELSVAETASLAALPKGPNWYAPTRNLKRHQSRRNLVLNAMHRNGHIDAAALAAAKAEPVRLQLCPSPGMRSHVAMQILQELQRQIGENQVYNGRLTVRTTLDIQLQQAAEQAVQYGLAAWQQRHPATRSNPPEAALIAMQSNSGAVRAMIGGADFAKSQFNRATQARRQSGSAIKPFLFALAVENGYQQSTLMQDAPGSYPGVAGANYNPDNYRGNFLGPVTLRSALELSLNSVPLQLTARLGVQPLQQMLRDLGVQSRLPGDLTLALGSASLTLLELTRAYMPFFENGVSHTPHFIEVVEDESGAAIWRPTLTSRKALTPSTAYIVHDMLRGVVMQGTATAVRDLGCDAAGKTGTSNNNRDTLFVGGINGLVSGVWVGFDDNRPLGKQETGAVAALPVWQRFNEIACNLEPAPPQPRPANVVIRPIDHSSGKQATTRCADRIEAAFVAGNEPATLCNEEL